MVALLLFAGLVVDVGYIAYQRRGIQGAADAAAMGAMLEMQAGGSASSIVSAGQLDASLNGFTHGASGTTVTINTPPTKGPAAGKADAVEAVVARSVPTMFMMLVGQNRVALSARASAIRASNGMAGCIYALSKTASGALTVGGSQSTNTACSAVVASTASDAFTIAGGSWFRMRNHANVGVTGGWNMSGGAVLWDVEANKSVQPQRIPQYPDPLASIPAPTSGTLRSAAPATYGKGAMPPGNTLQPGIYCGGIKVNSTDGVWLNMAPGTYIMAGGGFNTGAQAMVRAQNVTVYLSDSTNWGCASYYAFAPISMNGGSVLNISAPTSGPLAGIGFFQDRNIDTRSGNSNMHTFNGNSSSVFDCGIYLQKGAVTFTGNSSVKGYTVLVADTIKISGNTTINNDYSSLGTSNPFRPPSGGGLVE